MGVTLGTSLGLTGCSIAPVQAWQKEQLAHPQMGFDTDRLDTRYSEHIYFSREGSSGGACIGGGGCGCN
ncbi:MAG: DUF4266 domain-containing protein [Burkholderiaceae bacterium]